MASVISENGGEEEINDSLFPKGVRSPTPPPHPHTQIQSPCNQETGLLPSGRWRPFLKRVNQTRISRLEVSGLEVTQSSGIDYHGDKKSEFTPGMMRSPCNFCLLLHRTLEAQAYGSRWALSFFLEYKGPAVEELRT